MKIPRCKRVIMNENVTNSLYSSQYNTQYYHTFYSLFHLLRDVVSKIVCYNCGTKQVQNANLSQSELLFSRPTVSTDDKCLYNA